MAQPGFRDSLATGALSAAELSSQLTVTGKLKNQSGGGSGSSSGSGSDSDGDSVAAFDGPASAVTSGGGISDLLDSLARTRNVRRLLAAEGEVKAGIQSSLTDLEAASKEGSLPAGFDVAAWRDYVAFCLDMTADVSGGSSALAPAGSPLMEGREVVVAQMLKAAVAALPAGTRARMAAYGSDPLKNMLDAAGLDYEQIARGAQDLSAARSGLTSDAEALTIAAGTTIADPLAPSLPLDSSAGTVSGAATVPGGPAPSAAAGGVALPRPAVQQYYPLRPGATGRLPDDLAEVGLGAW